MKTPSLLFCPGDRPDRFRKALDRADTVILDLEDAVLLEDKEAARRAIVESDLPADRVIVRVNPAEGDQFQADLAAVVQTKYRTIMVAKAEDARVIANIPSTFRVIALCETARGVREVDEIADLQNVIGIMWGAEDLIASMGGTSSRDETGQYRDVVRYARSRVLIATRAAGKSAIDAVHTDIQDLDGLREEAEDAVAIGFSATACIHPSQAPVVREAYAPKPAQIEWAKAVLAAAADKPGAFNFEGQMIDEPILRHARSLVALSEEAK